MIPEPSTKTMASGADSSALRMNSEESISHSYRRASTLGNRPLVQTLRPDTERRGSGRLDRAQVLHDSRDVLTRPCLAFRRRAFGEQELQAPDRHLSLAVRREIRAAVDDRAHLVLGKATAVARGDAPQVRWRQLEERGHRAVAFAQGAVATRAVACKELGAGIRRQVVGTGCARCDNRQERGGCNGAS